MSALSEQDHLNPNDPSYYAPRWLREKPAAPPSPSAAPHAPSAAPPAPPRDKTEPVKRPAASASLDLQLESAVSDALWHPLDPEVIFEPAGFEQERDRRRALISVASRFAAAVGVSAVVALFFVIMIPVSRDHASQPDGSGSWFSGTMQSMKAALFQPPPKDAGSKPALSEFRTIAASNKANQAITHEQSETLLQQLQQWRQKNGPTEAPR
jgi:hypothetical protein